MESMISWLPYSFGELALSVMGGVVAAILCTSFFIPCIRKKQNEKRYKYLKGTYLIEKKFGDNVIKDNRITIKKVKNNVLYFESSHKIWNGKIAMNDSVPYLGEGLYTQPLKDGKSLWGNQEIHILKENPLTIYEHRKFVTSANELVVQGFVWKKQ